MSIYRKTAGWLVAGSLLIHPAQHAVAKTDEQPSSYYIEPGSYGTKRETDPPDYVRNLSKTGIKGTEDITWLDVGLDYRMRYERRENDVRRRPSRSLDEPILLRTRAYLGIKEILDPLRAVAEFEDARRYNSQFDRDNRDINEFELIQGYMELHFKDALGYDDRGNARPAFIRAGRMAFEFLDRRLIGLNKWRNTTNTFQGFRASLGEDANDWALDLLALQPLTRLMTDFDKPNQDQWFSSIIGHWRKWSDIVTIEPYYMALRQDASPGNRNRARDIHATGLRLSGWVSDTGINYDLTGTYQFGRDDGRQHDAYMVTAEVGYTFLEHPWKPRISAFYGHVTGDKDPNDYKNNRFERFFGFARPWSSDDYMIPENVIAPKVKIEFEPIKGLKFDGGYSAFWLESNTDRFNNLLDGSSFNRDPTGNSGDFLGHGLDFRARYNITPYIAANVGYTHFTNGEFTKNRQVAANGTKSNQSDFIYVELSFNALDIFK
ncbi:alginate export family protein [Methylotuvimicrobium alcaliphilum]|uniref:alginate export family protein n=1 Tax=Methylotuvimicrobium alcaliphilum TaxID=271065 RepID=UPI003B59AFA5